MRKIASFSIEEGLLEELAKRSHAAKKSKSRYLEGLIRDSINNFVVETGRWIEPTSPMEAAEYLTYGNGPQWSDLTKPKIPHVTMDVGLYVEQTDPKPEDTDGERKILEDAQAKVEAAQKEQNINPNESVADRIRRKMAEGGGGDLRAKYKKEHPYELCPRCGVKNKDCVC